MPERNITSVTILGCGYVGLATAALLSAVNITVYVIDPNIERLNSVRMGKAFFYEEGIDSLLALGVSKGLIIPATSYKDALLDSELVFSAVGTPGKSDGSADLSYIFSAARQTAAYIKPGAIFVQKSTVPVGTGRDVMRIFKKSGANVSYVSNPEFLREGSALKDSLWFDRIVVGGEDIASLQTVVSLYKKIEDARASIANYSKISSPIDHQDGVYIATTLESAELIKVVSNSFLALKISFANSVAQLADQVNADVMQVMAAVGRDPRIGKSFLNAGRGYGGGCFPKDVSGLIASAAASGVTMDILKAAQRVNEDMPEYIIEKLCRTVDKPMNKLNVTLLGLAYKAGTSDTRRSPSIKMANLLAEKGARVSVYDPQATGEALYYLDPKIQIGSDSRSAIRGSDVVIVATDWPEFKKISANEYASLMKGAIFVDAMNVYDMKEFEEAKLHYIGVGRGAKLRTRVLKKKPTEKVVL